VAWIKRRGCSNASLPRKNSTSGALLSLAATFLEIDHRTVAATDPSAPYLVSVRGFRFRDSAAAFEAFVAMARLSSGVIVFRRALPPRRPISARYFEMSDFTILTKSSTEAA
jgi:hypothetical protein